MNRRRQRSTGRRESGSFSAWPHACHDAETFKQLTLPARALLFEFLGQLRAANNGDLCCAYALLRPRGWRSRDTIERARHELEEAGWLIRTRQGGRNQPNLYAVTWRGVDDCGGKLDVPAGPPLGTWKNSTDMTGRRATVAREAVNPCTANGQHPLKVAREAG